MSPGCRKSRAYAISEEILKVGFSFVFFFFKSPYELYEAFFLFLRLFGGGKFAGENLLTHRPFFIPSLIR